MDENEKEQKEIEIVTGNGDLNISPVYNHIEVEKPRPKDTREIIIPEVKENITKDDNDTDPDDDLDSIDNFDDIIDINNVDD